MASFLFMQVCCCVYSTSDFCQSVFKMYLQPSVFVFCFFFYQDVLYTWVINKHFTTSASLCVASCCQDQFKSLLVGCFQIHPAYDVELNLLFIVRLELAFVTSQKLIYYNGSLPSCDSRFVFILPSYGLNLLLFCSVG